MLFPVVARDLDEDEISGLKSEIEFLYLNVVNRQPIRMIIVDAKYFLSMKRRYGENFKMIGYFLDERLVGFSSNIVHRDFWELHYIGLDYKINQTKSLYFNILYDALQNSIANGSTELELGRTARATKQIIGASPVYFSNYVRLKGKVTRLIVQLLSNRFNKRNSSAVMELRPFRNS